MSKAEYALLQDVIMDADFPDLDLALRRGRHVDRDDAGWYSLLTDTQELLEPFYRRYGCELIHKTDGYFYLLPTGEKVSRKQLSPSDMLVGQALALLYLDPAAVERGGVVSQEEIVGQLSAVLGSDALIGLFSPGKRKKQDERIAQRNVRQRVAEAVRRLAGLGFVEISEAAAVRLRAALLRFAEPVRGLSEPAEALAKLVAQGEIALTPEGAGEEPDDADGELDVAAEDALDVEADEPSVLESSHRELRGSRGAEVVAHPEWDELVPAAGGGGDHGDAGMTVDPGDVLAMDAAAVGGDEAYVAVASDVAVLDVATAAAASDDADAVGLNVENAERFSSDSSQAFLARAELGAGDGDAAASGDAWDQSRGSGVVTRPDAADGDEPVDVEHADAELSERSKPASAPARRVTPASDEDLDWADILLPGQDTEDGS